MAAFDPYHKWLGIPKDQRPPTLFQILGISSGEKDLEVIEEAAIRQTTHVRAYQIGPQAQECTRILNEIAKARQILLNPAKRKEYEEFLAKQTVKKTALPPKAASQEIQVTDKPPIPSIQKEFEGLDDNEGAAIKVKAGPSRRKSGLDPKVPEKPNFLANNKAFIIGAGALGGVALVGLLAFLFLRTSPSSEVNERALVKVPKDIGAKDKTTGDPVTEPLKKSDANPKPLPVETPPVEPPIPKEKDPVIPKKEDPIKPKVEPKEVEKVKDVEPVKNERAPVPSPEAVKAMETDIRSLFKKDYQKKSPQDYAALAEKLLERGQETKDDLTGRYVLFSESRDLAVKAGKAQLTMKIIAELADSFEVDAWDLKQSALAGLCKNTTKENAVELVDIGLGLAGEKLAEDQYETTLKVVAGIDAATQRLKNASLIAQVKNFEKQAREMHREFDGLKKAKEILAQDPSNQDANSQVGIFLALRKGDWDKGLPLLALSQPEWQAIAEKDMAKPTEPKELVELADTWWKAAEKKQGYQKASMQWRAAYWYRQAVPYLSGISLDKVADRVKQVDDQPPPFKAIDGVGEVQRHKEKLPITYMGLSNDGKRVFWSGTDGMVHEWTPATDKSKVLINPQQPIAYFAFSPDEKNIIIGSPTGYRVWNMLTFKPQRFMDNERPAIPFVHWLNASNVSFFSKTNFQTSNLNGGGSGGGPVTNNVPRVFLVAPSLNICMTLGADDKNIVYSYNNGFPFPELGTISYSASSGAFSPDGKFLALGGKDGSLRVFKDPRKLNEFQPLKGHAKQVRCIAISPNHERVLSGSDDRSVKLWDVATGRELNSFNSHQGTVRSVAFSPDGRYALSAGDDGTIRIWNLPK